MQKNKLLILMVAFLIFLPGCVPTQKILEELGIVTVIGFDLSEENEDQIKGTTIFFQFNPDTSNASQVINSEGKTIMDVTNKSNKYTMHYIVTGHLRALVFGPSVAEKGIQPYLDTFVRNAEVPNTYHVVMSLQPASELLQVSNFEEAPNIGAYLDQLLTNSVDNEQIIGSKQFEFMRTFFESGQDPTVPLLTLEDSKVKIGGIAMLQDDRYVGHVSTEDAFFVRLLKDKFKAGELTVDLPMEKFEQYLSENNKSSSKHLHVSLKQISSDSSIKLKDQNALKYEGEINFRGKLLEVSQKLQLEESDVLKEIEKQIEIKLKEKVMNVVKKSIELNSDIFGFGKIYYSSIRGTNITSEEWRQMFPGVELDLKVNVNLSRYGTID